MEMLDRYTRLLEACRRRWNQRTLEYVLQSARILRAARKVAMEEGRWLRWLRSGPRMTRVTAFRHLRVAEFVGSHVTLKQHLATLSISKVYALSRIERSAALRLAQDSNVRKMTDLTFAQYVRPFLPRKKRRATIPNLLRAVGSALTKAERAFDRWPRARRIVPPEIRARLMGQLHRLVAWVSALKGMKAAVV